MTNKSKLNCKKYIGYFDKINSEPKIRVCVEVLAENQLEALEKLQAAKSKSEVIKDHNYVLDTTMVYPCGKLEDLCKYDQNTILRCGYLISREENKEENIGEGHYCHI